MRLHLVSVMASLVLTTVAVAQTISPDEVIFNDGSVAVSLTGVPGNPIEGKKTFINRKLGNCLACHANEDASDHVFHGEVGPTLDGVADRWEEADLRGLLVNPKIMNEGTIMPSFYRLANGVRPLKKFQDKTILTAQQVEDVVAYLKTLKE